MRRSWIATALVLTAGACGGSSPAKPAAAAVEVPADNTATPTPTPAAPAVDYAALLAAPDRDDADRQLDEGRHPAQLLAFFDIRPGMKVAELGAGGGYTSELLARAVAPSGTVYGENSQLILDRFAQKPWTDRLAKPIMSHVVRLDRNFDDPFPAEVHDLDAVLIVLFYHDTVWQGVDRDKMNHAVFAALRSGGVYGVVDHSGKPGTGMTETQTVHRIEESALRAEIERAGFRLAGEADFLRNPTDTRDWNDSPKAAGDRRGTSDRFTLKFTKP
jgi:predicted methyltransferase